MAIDGKHCRIKAPRNAGSTFFNYKQTHSLILMAAVGPNYEFLYANVGVPGRHSDSGVFAATKLSRELQRLLPEEAPLPGAHPPVPMPYVCVGDEAFPLRRYILRPYPGARLTAADGPTRQKMRLFNYRLSRARRIVENGFGLLAQRFRILLRTIEMQPRSAKVVILACVNLHNYLLKQSRPAYVPPGAVDAETPTGQLQEGNWRRDAVLRPIRVGVTANYATREAADIRDYFREYFAGPGALAYQDNIVNRGFC